MRLKKLVIKNIGPFVDESMDFISNKNELETPPVIIITGENGTGKTIILDAIRTLFMGVFDRVEREITSSDKFFMQLDIQIDDSSTINLSCNVKNENGGFVTSDMEFNQLFKSQFAPKYKRNFIFDYWTSKLSNDIFNIDSIETLKTMNYLDETLKGVHRNRDISKIITFFDYLRDSKDDQEREFGISMYSLLESIINDSLNDGKLSHVSRIDLKPIVIVLNKEITLDKLSSGNLYLIQKLLSLVKQAYSICVINNIPIKEYKNIKGLLLIDEAENHLHPKWQKGFLNNILNIFPKLQIIATTHSPFIVSSVKNLKVYVCKSNVDSSFITEETDYYSNMPVEEILMSPLFNTSNFNKEISSLLKLRKEALFNKDKNELTRIEDLLLKINPEYFNYLNFEDLIKSIKR